jgi:hypothetical protein
MAIGSVEGEEDDGDDDDDDDDDEQEGGFDGTPRPRVRLLFVVAAWPSHHRT